MKPKRGLPQAYLRIRKRILFHCSYTFWLGIWYQVLRYSIPIISGILAAIVATFQNSTLNSSTFFIWISIIITFLGTLNSVIKPSESYDWTVIFASQFEAFLTNFDLEIDDMELKQIEPQVIIEFLQMQNTNLTKLIDEFNQPPYRRKNSG